MKIAIVSPMLLPVPDVKGGAVEMLTTYLIENNDKEGIYEIDLYTVWDERLKDLNFNHTKLHIVKISFFEKIIQKGINLFLRSILHSNKILNFYWIKMEKILRKYQYSKIIVENNMFLYKNIYEKNIYNNAELFYHMHNDINNIDKTEENYKLIEKTAKKIIVVSNFIKERLNSIEKTDKIEVLYNCIDVKEYLKTNAQNEFDQLVNIEEKTENDIYIGYIGRISKEKGLLELIKAFKIINNKNAKLVIVGSQWYGKIKKDSYYLQIESEFLDIKDKILFIGNKNKKDMPNIYDFLDIVVIPTICEEAFGMVALEAGIKGKSILLTRSGALPEIVTDKCGIVIEKGENIVENLANGIEILLNNKNLREDLGGKIQKRIKSEKNFNKENYFENFCKIIGGSN